MNKERQKAEMKELIRELRQCRPGLSVASPHQSAALFPGGASVLASLGKGEIQTFKRLAQSIISET